MYIEEKILIKYKQIKSSNTYKCIHYDQIGFSWEYKIDKINQLIYVIDK